MRSQLRRLEPVRRTRSLVVDDVTWNGDRRGTRYRFRDEPCGFAVTLVGRDAVLASDGVDLILDISELQDLDSFLAAWSAMRIQLAAIVGFGLWTKYFGEIPLFHAPPGRVARAVLRDDTKFERVCGLLWTLERSEPELRRLGPYQVAHALVSSDPLETHAFVARSADSSAVCTRGSVVLSKGKRSSIEAERSTLDWIRRGCSGVAHRPVHTMHSVVIDPYTAFVIAAATRDTRN